MTNPVIDNLDTRIRSLTEELTKLTKQREEYLKQPDNQMLADLMHGRMCHSNHIDGCSWEYENWNSIRTHEKPTKTRYLDRATKVLVLVNNDLDLATKIVIALTSAV